MVAYSEARIFIIGGYYEDNYHSSVEMLDLETNEWSFLCPLPEPRYHAGATAVNGYVLLLPDVLSSSAEESVMSCSILK